MFNANSERYVVFFTAEGVSSYSAGGFHGTSGTSPGAFRHTSSQVWNKWQDCDYCSNPGEVLRTGKGRRILILTYSVGYKSSNGTPVAWITYSRNPFGNLRWIWLHFTSLFSHVWIRIGSGVSWHYLRYILCIFPQGHKFHKRYVWRSRFWLMGHPALGLDVQPISKYLCPAYIVEIPASQSSWYERDLNISRKSSNIMWTPGMSLK